LTGLQLGLDYRWRQTALCVAADSHKCRKQIDRYFVYYTTVKSQQWRE